MKIWWKRFNKLVRLPWSDQRLLAEAFAVVAAMKLGLKLLPFDRFRGLYSALNQVPKSKETPSRVIERRVWAIQKVSGPLSAVCLPQALALTYFLRKNKAVALMVGVRKNGSFEAHAWVEKNGTTLIGQLPDAHFQPLWVWH